MSKVQDFFLQNFMSQLKDGFRPNQFKVELVVPSALRGQITNSTEAEEKITFMCKGTNLPASTIGVVPVPFRGRAFQISGDRVFAPWTVTVLADTNDTVRNMVEQWSDHINGHVNHDSTLGNNPLDYMSSGDIHQLSRNGDVLQSYKLIGIWPSEIGEMALDFGTNDTIGEYTLTLQIQWWENQNTRNNTEASDFSRTGGQEVVSF